MKMQDRSRSRRFGILHVCSVRYCQGDGMVNIIPEHVKQQAKYADTVLINLQDKKFETGLIPSFNYEDYKNIGFSRLLHGFVPDLAVIHGIYQPDLIIFWQKHIRNKMPYVVIPHGAMTFGLQRKGFLKKQVFNLLFSFKMSRNSLGVQFLSQDEKKHSLHLFYKRCFVQPNGLCLPAVHKEFSGHCHKDEIKILYIGRYDLYHKGLDLLLKACYQERLYMRSHKIYLDLYGEHKNSDIKILSRFVKRKKIDDIVRLHQGVYEKAKEEKILESDYFIHTSRLEGMPLSITEAFAYGLPVLVTDGTNAACIVTKYRNGFCAETSVRGIRELLHLAVNHKGRLHVMSDRSLECSKQYDWDIVSKETVYTYRKLITRLKKGII